MTEKTYASVSNLVFSGTLFSTTKGGFKFLKPAKLNVQ